MSCYGVVFDFLVFDEIVDEASNAVEVADEAVAAADAVKVADEAEATDDKINIYI